jgi:hypothetical protein
MSPGASRTHRKVTERRQLRHLKGSLPDPARPPLAKGASSDRASREAARRARAGSQSAGEIDELPHPCAGFSPRDDHGHQIDPRGQTLDRLNGIPRLLVRPRDARLHIPHLFVCIRTP